MVYRRIEFAKAGIGTRIAGLLAALLGIGLAIALLLLSVGIALVLLPVVIVALLVGRWRWKKFAAQAGAATGPRNGSGPVIELDYEVIDRDRKR